MNTSVSVCHRVRLRLCLLAYLQSQWTTLVFRFFPFVVV